MAIFSYALASGYNVALVSLVNVENIIPTGSRRLYPPKSFGTYNPGAYRIRGDGTLYLAGFPELAWNMGRFLYAQHRYFMTTYCASGYSGNVTIYSMTDNYGTYARLNAVMVLPKLAESQNNFKIFPNYTIRFTRLEASS